MASELVTVVIEMSSSSSAAAIQMAQVAQVACGAARRPALVWAMVGPSGDWS